MSHIQLGCGPGKGIGATLPAIESAVRGGGPLMRRNLLASTAFTTSTLVTGAALAADMAVKAPPPAPIPFSWTGCYVGGNAGWASTSIDQSAAVPTAGLSSSQRSFAYDSSGRDNSFIGGVQAGCNLQFDPK